MRLYRIADRHFRGPYSQNTVDATNQFCNHVKENGQPSPICDGMMNEIRYMLDAVNIYSFKHYAAFDMRFAFTNLVGMYYWFRNDIEFLVTNNFRLYVIEAEDKFVVKGKISKQAAFLEDYGTILKAIKLPPSLDMARKGVRIRKREKMKCS